MDKAKIDDSAWLPWHQDYVIRIKAANGHNFGPIEDSLSACCYARYMRVPIVVIMGLVGKLPPCQGHP